ncbi:hypothetical protein BDV40DRAFT_295593 [Aspergillus tamarii]|uniref:Uncharacterized protein n=1 Tax=Aspergillus tamarii TaxID=41984 RepID=A0A5N6V9S7_ASPTM|nr:hypothetical protein BDV40DRAFT_295593 [Aspergillus tamarii]
MDPPLYLVIANRKRSFGGEPGTTCMTIELTLMDFRCSHPLIPPPKRDRKRFNADSIDGNHPDILAWQRHHPGLVDEDYHEATGGYGATTRGLVAPGSIYSAKAATGVTANEHDGQPVRKNPGSLQAVEHRILDDSVYGYEVQQADSPQILGYNCSLSNRMLHIELPKKLSVQYYPKPSQYLAASMRLAGYNMGDQAKSWTESLPITCIPFDTQSL